MSNEQGILNFNNYLWLDFETTGGIDGIDGHGILEVAVMLTGTDPKSFFGNDVHSWVTDCSEENLANMPDVVVDMHTKSGLLACTDNVVTVEEAEAAILDLIEDEVGDAAEIILAGSGVARFDRMFLRRDMPELNERLKYWEFDISSLRTGLREAGLGEWIPTASPFGSWPLGRAHRAADDVRDHVFCAYEMLRCAQHSGSALGLS